MLMLCILVYVLLGYVDVWLVVFWVVVGYVWWVILFIFGWFGDWCLGVVCVYVFGSLSFV